MKILAKMIDTQYNIASTHTHARIHQHQLHTSKIKNQRKKLYIFFHIYTYM